MIYQQFAETRLSMLGYGTMRFPRVGGKQDGPVDEVESARLVKIAMENGVNYYDTAYPYSEGNGELVVGRILSQYPRASFYLASKYPGFLEMESYNAPEMLDRQLKRCQVDYFDFYLLHNVAEKSFDTYTSPKWHIVDDLVEAKKQGKIRHLGFSSHAKPETMKKFLERYADQMEFCQLQLNYLDWTLQDAKQNYELVTSYGLPIWVMEPVRGGRLASLLPEAEMQLKAARPQESIASWAFRWLQGLENVKMVLSGMTTEQQLRDNLEIFSKEEPLTESQLQLLERIAAGMQDFLPCTKCRYCCEGCPKQLDIPALLAICNENRYTRYAGVENALRALEAEKRPSACIGCSQCTKVCPQGISIPEELRKLALLEKNL